MGKIKLNLNLEKSGIDCSKSYENAIAIYKDLQKDQEPFTGWVNWPENFSDEMFEEIEKVAKRVRRICDVLVVIGIGGSYLGTAAVYQAMGGSSENCPELIFAGNTLSGEEMSNVLDVLKSEETCLCVVSKSGKTLETKLAYSILKQALIEKYGEAASDRIVVITDSKDGDLRKEVEECKYDSFDIPKNIGGRYSAFTPAILFPLSVAGIDIKTFVNGAKEISTDEKFWKEQGLKYAVSRFELYNNGKSVEEFGFFEPSLRLVGEWIKQLFAESEGKEGKGLFPSTAMFCTDLHSVGQYLQEGRKIFFETLIDVKNNTKDTQIFGNIDGSFEGKTMNDINHITLEGMVLAHSKAGVPIMRIIMEEKNEYCLGQLLYFLMMTAGVTGKLMHIDPFTQDGVEQYKTEIRNILGANKE